MGEPSVPAPSAITGAMAELYDVFVDWPQYGVAHHAEFRRTKVPHQS